MILWPEAFRSDLLSFSCFSHRERRVERKPDSPTKNIFVIPNECEESSKKISRYARNDRLPSFSLPRIYGYNFRSEFCSYF